MKNNTMKKIIAFALSAAAAVCCMTACGSSDEVSPEEELKFVNDAAQLVFRAADDYVTKYVMDGQIMKVPKESAEFRVKGASGEFERTVSKNIPEGCIYVSISPALKVDSVQFTSPYSEYVGQYPAPNEDTDSDVEWKGSETADMSRKTAQADE